MQSFKRWKNDRIKKETLHGFMNNTRKTTLRKAFLASLPVMAGYVVLGIGFGILLRQAGYGLVWSFLMSLTVYAGAMQYVAVSLITQGATLLTSALTALMVNARHLFYGVSMIDAYKDAGKEKGYLIFALTDETYSLLCTGKTPEGASPRGYRFFVSLFNQCYWLLGSVLGSLMGSLFAFGTAGIEFSMTALFVTVLTEQWLANRDHRPAVTGLACSAVCLALFGPDRFLIPSMMLITLMLLWMKRTGKEDTADAA